MRLAVRPPCLSVCLTAVLSCEAVFTALGMADMLPNCSLPTFPSDLNVTDPSYCSRPSSSISNHISSSFCLTFDSPSFPNSSWLTPSPTNNNNNKKNKWNSRTIQPGRLSIPSHVQRGWTGQLCRVQLWLSGDMPLSLSRPDVDRGRMEWY